MDGIKKRLTDSVQLRLSVGLCAAIVFVAVLTGAIAFISALDEAHELQDASLNQIAELVNNGTLQARNSNLVSPAFNDEKGSKVIVHFMISAAAAADDNQENVFPLPNNLGDGFQTLKVGEHVYRVLINTLNHDAKVAIAQRISVRDEVAMASAWRTLMPFLLLMPILLLVVADLVKKIFRPIRTLADEVNQREKGHTEPLALDGLPAEIRPFIAAINRLLGRAAQSVEQQRRFVADAAHELRSPLTALTLQTDRLAAAELPAAARERVMTLQKGMRRTSNLLEQLLTLARVQSNNEPLLNPPRVNVNQVMRQVLEDLMPLAESKSLDLGVIAADNVECRHSEFDVFTLIKNLVDNAIRYTPDYGCIDLRLIHQPDTFIIEVEDNGPGIPIAQRNRVMDAFYRIEGNTATGSGLGLSIVQAITVRLRGEISLKDAERHAAGLNVNIRLPYDCR